MIRFVIAVALLNADPGEPVPPAAFALASKLQDLAIEMQILDLREVRYVLVRSQDFDADILLLRRRRLELAATPLLEDAARFPERSTVNEYLAFNRAYRQHLDIRQPGEPSRVWVIKAALAETDRLYAIWDKVRDARCEYYYVTVRRRALNDLRELLGNEAYYSGRLPPYIPLWRFQEVR